MGRTCTVRTIAAAALLLTSVLSGPARPEAGQGEAEGAGKPQDVESRPADIRLADLELLDQDGRRVRFRSDVIRDRLVVIDVIYTTCPLACPILSATFFDLQEALGDRLGTEVSLISVSVDPNTDIPPRLKEYAQRWDAKPGWVFLTGAKGNIDEVLKGLGAYAADFTEHPTMMLVGDGKSGGWTRYYGFPTTGQLLARVNELSAARKAGPDAATKGGGTR